MAAGDPLAKYWTYQKIEDLARLRTATIDDTKISASLALDLINISIEKWAKILNAATAPWYSTVVTTPTIAGTANPYTVAIDAVTPFLDDLKRVTHVTTGGTRTLVKRVPFEEGEASTAMTSPYASSIFYTFEGDTLRLWKGSSFTITIATDLVHLLYYRLPAVSGVTRTSKIDIPDAYSDTIVKETCNQIMMYKSGGRTDPTLDASLQNDRQAIDAAFGLSKQVAIAMGEKQTTM